MTEQSNSGTGVPLSRDGYDAVILGAGISGLVTAAILLDQGNSKILLVDEYEQVGGNHMDRAINGYTFDVGSFIFQDDSPLLRYFPELLDSYVHIRPSWARLNPQGRVTRYPFSVRDDLLGAGPYELARILASAVRSRFSRRPMMNAEDFAVHWLGARFVSRSGLGRYMERFCGLPIDQIDLTFAEQRMLWIAENARVRTQAKRVVRKILGRWGRSKGPSNRQMARPPEGFKHLYAPVAERLRSQGVTFVLGAELRGLEQTEEGFRLLVNGEALMAHRVVSTIPIDRALSLASVEHAFLPTVTLVTLFYSLTGDRGFDEAILYNFSHDAAWKRLTVYSDFYGLRNGREYFAVEVIGSKGRLSPEASAAEFAQHARENGLLMGDLRLEGSNVLEHAYPIYTRGSAGRAVAGILALRELGIESFDRQGGFRYQPTARVSTIEAEAALGQRHA